MSDVTDLNALPGLLEALACDCENTDGWQGAAPDLRKAATLLRTLAERQPVGDGEVTPDDREAFASVCAGWWRNMKPEKIAEFARAGEIDNNELIQAFARHRQAAEQRGADRAFEEAAGIASKYESNHNHERAHAAYQIAEAIRQRIGGQ